MRKRNFRIFSLFFAFVMMLAVFAGCGARSTFFASKNLYTNAESSFLSSILPQKVLDSKFDLSSSVNASIDLSVSDFVFTGFTDLGDIALDNAFDITGKVLTNGAATSAELDIGDYDVDVYDDGESVKAIINNFLDEPVSIALNDFIGIGGEGKYIKAIASVSDFLTDAESTIKKQLSSASVTAKSEESEYDGEICNAIRYTLTADKDTSVKLLNAIADCFDKYKNVAAVFGTDSDIGQVIRDYTSLMSTTESFGIVWERVIYKGNVVSEKATVSSSDADPYKFVGDYSKSSAFSVTLTDYDDVEIFSIDYSCTNEKTAATISTSSGIALTVSTTYPGDDKDNPNIDVNLTSGEDVVIDGVFDVKAVSATADEVRLDISFDGDFGLLGFSGTLKGSITFKPENTEPKPIDESGCLVLKNEDTSVDVYKKMVEKLTSLNEEIGELFPTDLSLEYDYLAGADESSYAAIIDGVYYPVNIYAYQAQYNRDYYEYLTNYYYADQSFADSLKMELDGGETLNDYIIRLSRENFALTFIIENKFNELNLHLKLTDLVTIEKTLFSNTTEEEVKAQFGLDKSGFKFVFSTAYKQRALLDYYLNTDEYIATDEAFKEYFTDNYAKVKCIAFYTTGESGEELSEEELAAASANAQECYDKITAGDISFSDAIIKYASDYYTAEEIAEYDEQYQSYFADYNNELLNGIVTDSSGTTDSTFYYSFGTEAVAKIFEIDADDVCFIEDSHCIWVIQKVELTDEDYSLRSADIKSNYQNKASEQIFTEWLDSIECEFNEKIVAKYIPSKLTSFFN